MLEKVTTKDQWQNLACSTSRWLKHNKGKVSITFDCSCQYRGASINKNLLSGPDLTNQLVGV